MANIYYEHPYAFKNTNYTGSGYIAGTLSVDNVPAIRRVCLFLEENCKLIKTTYSDKNGNYSFTGLRTDVPFFVVGIDDTGVKNADIVLYT